MLSLGFPSPQGHRNQVNIFQRWRLNLGGLKWEWSVLFRLPPKILSLTFFPFPRRLKQLQLVHLSKPRFPSNGTYFVHFEVDLTLLVRQLVRCYYSSITVFHYTCLERILRNFTNNFTKPRSRLGLNIEITKYSKLDHKSVLSNVIWFITNFQPQIKSIASFFFFHVSSTKKVLYIIIDYQQTKLLQHPN